MVLKITNDYIAGFIDGEGWLGISKYKNGLVNNVPRYFPECRITNTNIDILEYLKSKYGKGTHLITMKKETGKKCYQLKFYGQALRRLIEDMKGRLIIKSEQRKVLIIILNSMTTSRRQLTPEIIELRESCYLKCRKLNSGYVPTEAQLPILEARG